MFDRLFSGPLRIRCERIIDVAIIWNHAAFCMSGMASMTKSKRSDPLPIQSNEDDSKDSVAYHPHHRLRYSKTLSPWPSYNPDHQIPAYRVLSPCGKLNIPSDQISDTPIGKLLDDQEKCLRIYRSMLSMHHMDHILYNSQRQGRISFYMTNFGEEATVVASAAALNDDDPIFAQYREVGALIYRGFTLSDIMNQVVGNMGDLGKGRQMPVHYGSKDLNYFTISSPLATQIPQASGAAYAIKAHNERCKSQNGSPRVIACYFGEGAASEGDFHAGLNFAATLKCPVIFICRNNGYAISTPISDQYAGDGIGSRGLGYGIHHTYRVDGNDVFAVYDAVRKGREYAIKDNVPVLIEAMTYRVGHHSTSDDSSVYRKKEEVDTWSEKSDPMVRFRKFIQEKGWWNDEKETSFVEDVKSQVKSTFHAASNIKKPCLDELFNDVYDELPWNLVEQKQELFRILKEYPDSPLSGYTNEHHNDG